jgi:hypothetical protein
MRFAEHRQNAPQSYAANAVPLQTNSDASQLKPEINSLTYKIMDFSPILYNGLKRCYLYKC